MRLLNLGNYMRVYSVFLLIFCFVISCKVSTPLPSEIIRYDYFDSNYYKMEDIDSNKVNRMLYQHIFNKIDFDTTAKCLMLRIYSNSSVYNEYGLYDYKTQTYYSYSTDSKSFHLIKEPLSAETKALVDNLKYFVDDPTKAMDSVNNKTNIMDGNNFELSLITVNAQNEIIVKSYYW